MTPAASPAHGPAGYTDREITHPPPWHGLVAWDVFFNALTTGLFLIAAVGELARPEVFAVVGRWAYPVALVVLLADLSCLVLDLGNPARFHHMLRVFKPLSPMSLGTWFLAAYSLPLTLLVVADVATLCGWSPGGWIRITLLVVGLPLAFGSAAYKGVLFSVTAQPGWRDARWLGAYHTSGALVAGGAGFLLLSILTGNADAARALRLPLGVLVVLNMLTFTQLVADLRDTLARAHSAAHRRWFLGAVLGGGVALPLGLLLVGGAIAEAAAAVLILAASFSIRSMVVHLPHAIRPDPNSSRVRR